MPVCQKQGPHWVTGNVSRALAQEKHEKPGTEIPSAVPETLLVPGVVAEKWLVVPRGPVGSPRSYGSRIRARKLASVGIQV